MWASCLRKNITRIENVQRRFTKRVTGMDIMEYEQTLMVLKSPSLEYRRAKGDMNETFKIIHVYYDHETVCEPVFPLCRPGSFFVCFVFAGGSGILNSNQHVWQRKEESM